MAEIIKYWCCFCTVFNFISLKKSNIYPAFFLFVFPLFPLELSLCFHCIFLAFYMPLSFSSLNHNSVCRAAMALSALLKGCQVFCEAKHVFIAEPGEECVCSVIWATSFDTPRIWGLGSDSHGLAMVLAVQGSAEQCSAVQCSAVQCSAVQCSAVQCSAVQ